MSGLSMSHTCCQHKYSSRFGRLAVPPRKFVVVTWLACFYLLLPEPHVFAVSGGPHNDTLLCRWYAGQPDLSGILPDDAARWTEHFAALSYGDPLFSLALSPLLSTHSPPRVQVV